MNHATQSFLGRYRLVKVLGQGAMGVVYEAVDTRLGRTVAIKTVLRSHLADDSSAGEYASRFEREAQAAARLAHPNIVTVHDFGEHEDISYIVMEFVRGQELSKVFEAGQALPLTQTLRIMAELLAALDFAHTQGIVHRDVKPANVMLDAGGHVKLTDFGVARVANTTQDRTMPGTLVGTPSYMAPEQVLGLAVGSRADIFAAGVILYQCLTGQRPFAGAGPFAVQRQIVQDDPKPPSAIAPQLPRAFDDVIARALAKQPEDRYASAAAFAEALADLEAASTRRATAPEAGAQAHAAADHERKTGSGSDRDERRTGVESSAQASARPAATPASAPRGSRTGSAPTLRRTVLPLLAGALVAVLAMAAWILFLDPAPAPATSTRSTPATSEAATSGLQPSPVPAEPAPPAPVPAENTPAPQERHDTPQAAAPPQADEPARSEPAPRIGPPREPRPRPRADADRQERREVLGARCSDLLQRMQIGEPLTPEQSQYFQTRCTR